MITALAVATDRDEYSRYAAGLGRVGVRIDAAGAAGGESVHWALVRLDGFGTVAEGDWTLDGPRTWRALDLNALRDADGLNWCSGGRYALSVTAGALGAEAQFRVAVVTLDELRGRYIYGVPTTALEMPQLVLPPQTLTAVRFERLSVLHELGRIPLSWDAASQTLTWTENGLPQPVDTSQALPQRYLLWNETQSEYAEVVVDPQQLAATPTTTEYLGVDRKVLDADTFASFVRQAQQYVESALTVPVELRRAATVVVQQRYPRYYDWTLEPVTYYRPYQTNQWLNINLPAVHVRKVYRLQGYFNDSLAVDISLDWVTVDRLTGLVQLVPRSGALVSWSIVQSTFLTMLHSYEQVPGFWHYDIAYGLDDLQNPTYAVVREAIAKKAAVEILLQAGAAYKPGIASEAVSRDGVSETVVYTQSAMYGLHASTIEPYVKWLNDTLPRLRQRLCGPNFVTL